MSFEAMSSLYLICLNPSSMRPSSTSSSECRTGSHKISPFRSVDNWAESRLPDQYELGKRPPQAVTNLLSSPHCK